MTAPKPRRVHQFRARVAVLVLLSGTPGFALSGYTYWEQHRYASEEAKHAAVLLSALLEQRYNQIVTEARLVLEAAASLPDVALGERSDCDRDLARIKSRYPYFVNLAVAGSDGKILCGALPFKGMISIADRGYFVRALQTWNFSVGGYQIGHITKKPTINFGYPVIGTEGNISAVVFAALDFEWIKNSIAKVGLPSDSAITLVRPDGRVLARYPQPEQWVGRTFPKMALLRSNLERNELVMSRDSDGLERFYAFHALENVHKSLMTYLSVAIPRASLFGAADRELARNLSILGAATLLMTVGALLFGQRLVLRPLMVLIAAARRFAGGHLTTRSGIDYTFGEIGQLAYSFDNLAQSLQQLIAERERMAGEVRAARDRLDALVRASPLAIYTFDLDSRITNWNAAAEKLYGWREHELLGHPLPIVPEGGRTPEHHALRTRVLQGEVVIGLEGRRRRRDGTLLDVNLSMAPLYDAEGRVCGRMTIVNDVTERKRAEADLVQSLSLLQATLDATADGILVVSTAGGIKRYNEKFARMWGIPQEVLVARNDAQVLEYVLEQLKDPQGFLARVKELYAQPEAESRDLISFKDGRIFERHSQPQRVGGKIVGRVWSFSDITERCQAEERLVKLAQYDALTDLPNRALFRDRIMQAMARATRHEKMLALMFIDLDGFKTINDTLGHRVGDIFLQQLARRLTDCLRETDTVARMGGDEFGVVLGDVTQVDQVSAVAEKILRVVAQSMVIDGTNVAVSASIGITLYPFGAEDMNTLLAQADLAMYRAKERGRNNYQFFEYEMNVRKTNQGEKDGFRK